jgi:predicted dehydrogenase
MNYTTQPFSFKLKKAARYVRLYGARRTFIKVQSQYHMKKKYDRLPTIKTKTETNGRRHVGIIGCGNFAFANIAFYLERNYGKVIRAAMDIDINRAASLFERYDLNYYTDDPDKLIEDPNIDILFIVSNHASHADYAIKALDAGKHVHIEKPHAVNEDQLTRLCAAISRSKGKVNLGFNRPGSPFGREIKRCFQAQPGAAMYNWFISGHELPPGHWYLNEGEGGRVLGNLCHWTDFVYQMMPSEGLYPIQIIPGRADKPDRDIAVTYIFGDGSIAAITFWEAKGHAFEGVRERLTAQRGEALIALEDFKRLAIEVVEKKRVHSGIFRNHGHEALICRSYQMARPRDESASGCDLSYVWGTGQLFLKTKEALETNQKLTLISADNPISAGD